MSSFTEKISVTQIDKNHWRLNKSFRYYIGEENSFQFVDVPKNFISDGSSIPKFFWSVVGHPMGETAQCGFLHDFLYHLRGSDKIPPRPRKECDEIFLEAMTVLEVSGWKRYSIFYAVRSFGWIAWRKKR